MPIEKSTDSLYLQKLKYDPQLENSFIGKVLSNFRIVILAVLALVGAGLFSFFNLPREQNPEVKIPIVGVSTVLPGAPASDVEELISKKIEQELQNISEVDVMSSVSQDSLSLITLQFISSTDPDDALNKVKEKVDLVTDLPEEATVPVVIKADFNDRPVLQVMITGDTDYRSLSEIAREVKEVLERDSSVRKVEIGGELVEELVIKLDETSLQSYGISAAQISQQLPTE